MRLSLSGFLILIGLTLAVGAAKLAGPFAGIREQEAELNRLSMEKDALLVEERGLQQYKDHLATDRGLERAARRKGYLRPGERRLVFTPPAAGSSDRRAAEPE